VKPAIVVVPLDRPGILLAMTNPDNEEKRRQEDERRMREYRDYQDEKHRLFLAETKRKEDAGYGWVEIKYVPGERNTEIKQITVNETGVLIHAVVIFKHTTGSDTSLWRSKNAGITWERLQNAAPRLPQ
jgi:hypothetical protein